VRADATLSSRAIRIPFHPAELWAHPVAVNHGNGLLIENASL
jgi:hypothetical protein